MANDLFGNLGNFGGALGGLMGGLATSGLVPKDTPEGKLLAAQTDVTDLQKQEAELLVEIGRQAYNRNPSEWPQDAKLKLIQQNLAAAQSTLEDAKREQKEAEAAKAEDDAKGLCPECGHKNPEDIKFCQECGTPLGAAGSKHCTSCGADLKPGIRFCGECGARQE